MKPLPPLLQPVTKEKFLLPMGKSYLSRFPISCKQQRARVSVSGVYYSSVRFRRAYKRDMIRAWYECAGMCCFVVALVACAREVSADSKINFMRFYYDIVARD